MDELSVFIWNGSKAEAQSGYNDDLVMPFGIGMFLRDTSLRFQQHNMDMARNAISNIQKRDTQTMVPGTRVQNPYIQKVGNQMEDIKWLL